MENLILYNWPKIVSKSDGRVSKMLEILSHLTFKLLPVNEEDFRFKVSQENWSGDSFLLNPSKIFIHRHQFKSREIAEYVALAALRSYAEYKATRKTTLSLIQCPVEQVQIKDNRLLSFWNNEIYFCWEEVH